ncbi:MAG: hypothetical protein ABIT07_00955 [Ferruginibacter sp.]
MYEYIKRLGINQSPVIKCCTEISAFCESVCAALDFYHDEQAKIFIHYRMDKRGSFLSTSWNALLMPASAMMMLLKISSPAKAYR